MPTSSPRPRGDRRWWWSRTPEKFAAALAAADDDLDVYAIELVKDTGQTMIAGQGRFEGPAWTWLKR